MTDTFFMIGGDLDTSHSEDISSESFEVSSERVMEGSGDTNVTTLTVRPSKQIFFLGSDNEWKASKDMQMAFTRADPHAFVMEKGQGCPGAKDVTPEAPDNQGGTMKIELPKEGEKNYWKGNHSRLHTDDYPLE
jgi:hypothetical protein